VKQNQWFTTFQLIPQFSLSSLKCFPNVSAFPSAAETKKVLLTLRSSKAPLVKKRFVMQKTFGDYRKLMRTQPVPDDVLAAIVL
jgi:Domain of unknown function (DUF4615)